MAALETPYPARLPQELHPVILRVIIGTDEVYVLVRPDEVNHQLEFIGPVNVIVFGEIDQFGILLFHQDFNLSKKGLAVANPRKSQKHQIFWREVLLEQLSVFIGTSIQEGPDLRPQA